MSGITNRSIAVGLALPVLSYGVAGAIFGTSYRLTLFGNVMQLVLQAICLLTFVLNAKNTRGSRRIFWGLFAAGVAVWLIGQAMWTYYENILRIQVPDAYPGDMIFFLHIVPMLAATALQPHAEFPEGDRFWRVGALDFTLLMLWWVFLFLYVAYPWQYVDTNIAVFNDLYNYLYLAENLSLIAALLVLWRRPKGSWKNIYGHLLVAACLYGVSSRLVNFAIDTNIYYTGSLYDLPLVGSMAWFAYTGFIGLKSPQEQEPSNEPLMKQAARNSMLATLALLTMPLLAVYAVVGATASPKIGQFRLMLTLLTMVGMMMLLFLRQHLLDRRLLAALSESRESYDRLKQLQGQLVQTEKLASLGRLVSGAAHEINNPLTAIFGYADLLASKPGMDNEGRDFAEKIRQQARRTKGLVSSLLAFGKQAPMQRKPVDMNGVVQRTIQLHGLNPENKEIETVRHLFDGLPKVMGDENQLLQVCLHLFDNAADAIAETKRPGKVTVTTLLEGENVVLRFSDTGPGVEDALAIFDPFYTTKEVGKGTGLGLSASYGIIREHGGDIRCENLPEGGAVFIISLPALPAEAPSATAADKTGLFNAMF